MNIASVLASKGPTVVTVGPDQTVREALTLLATHNIGALVVTDDGRRLLGMLSERDIVRHLARDASVLDGAVRGIMTREVVVGLPQDDLGSVAQTMTERRIRHLPVMDRGRLVGIVSIGDVVKAQRDQFLGERDTLQTQLLERSA